MDRRSWSGVWIVCLFVVVAAAATATPASASGGDGACSNNGRSITIAGATQCACDAGYAGVTCELCAVGYERGADGVCKLGAIARRDICLNKGTPFLNRYGDIACRCDAGFSGADCGGPDLVVAGYTRSVEAGRQLPLKVSGGSGVYQWELLSPRGGLTIVDAKGAQQVYHAPAPPDVQQVETVHVRVHDTATPQHTRDFWITVTPAHALAATGIPVPDLVSFDQAMLDYMKGRGIRAGVLAVAKDGHLVLSRGYGYMDKGVDATPFIHDDGGVGYVGPSTPMRIASVTKPITAAAVREGMIALVGDPNISNEDLDEWLETPAMPYIEASLGDAITSMAEQWFPFTPDGTPYYVETDVNHPYDDCLEFQENAMPDSRWQDITIRDLLGHRGGFDRTKVPSPRWQGGFAPPPALTDTSYLATTGDPNFKPVMMIYDLAHTTGLEFTGPLRPKNLVQYMAGFCLAYTPGTQQEYSNFGYTLLGRVLEGLHNQKWVPGNGSNRRVGWGPYIDIIESFLAGYGITGITAGRTGSFSSDNPDTISSTEPYYRELNDDGSEPLVLGVGGPFGVAPNGDMYGLGGVPIPYGGWSMQTMESHGGLVATAPALIAFMRHFLLMPGDDWGANGSRRISASVGNAAHSGFLPGTYSLAWQMQSGYQTFNKPLLTGRWDQASAGTALITGSTSCTLPTGIDVVAIFNQARDPKGDITEYQRLAHFLGAAACQVTTWPTPLGPSDKATGQ